MIESSCKKPSLVSMSRIGAVSIVLLIFSFLSALGAGAADYVRSSDWQKTIGLAKSEGKLMLSGPPSQAWRAALTAFEKDFPGIKIEYAVHNARDFWPKLVREQAIGQYLWDLRVGGADVLVYQVANNGSLQDIRHFLNADIADDSKWLGGVDGLFSDNKKKYVVGFSADRLQSVWRNADIIPDGVFSVKDLIDPKYKAKIVLQDPRAGAGLGGLTELLAGQGEDFVRKLLTEQDIVVTGDNRQQTEWLVRGKYPLAIGSVSSFLIDFENRGMKHNAKFVAGSVKTLTSGFAGLQVPKNIPHPNATAVYINWLLSARGQEILAKGVETNSRRLDVKPGAPWAVVHPSELKQYVYPTSEAEMAIRQKALRMSTELIK